MSINKIAKKSPAEAGAVARYPILDFRVAAYPSWTSLYPWRWEFLRRYPLYQVAFSQHGSSEPPDPLCLEFGLRCWLDPKREWHQIYTGFLPGGYAISLPTFADLKRWQTHAHFDAQQALESLIRGFEDLKWRGHRAFAIDLSLPLEPQFDMIQEIASDRSMGPGEGVVTSKIKKPHLRSWQRYLRIMDAKAAGATTAEISGVVFPDDTNQYPNYSANKKVEVAFKKALRLCETFAIQKAALE